MVINPIYEFTPPPISFPYRGRVKYPRQKLYVFAAISQFQHYKVIQKIFSTKNILINFHFTHNPLLRL